MEETQIKREKTIEEFYFCKIKNKRIILNEKNFNTLVLVLILYVFFKGKRWENINCEEGKEIEDRW